MRVESNKELAICRFKARVVLPSWVPDKREEDRLTRFGEGNRWSIFTKKTTTQGTDLSIPTATMDTKKKRPPPLLLPLNHDGLPAPPPPQTSYSSLHRLVVVGGCSLFGLLTLFVISSLLYSASLSAPKSLPGLPSMRSSPLRGSSRPVLVALACTGLASFAYPPTTKSVTDSTRQHPHLQHQRQQLLLPPFPGKCRPCRPYDKEGQPYTALCVYQGRRGRTGEGRCRVADMFDTTLVGRYCTYPRPLGWVLIK